MDKIKLRFDPTDNTLQVWFDDPQRMAYLSPLEGDTPGDLFLVKDEAGRVIGLECQFYHLPPGSVAVELDSASLDSSLVPALLEAIKRRRDQG